MHGLNRIRSPDYLVPVNVVGICLDLLGIERMESGFGLRNGVLGKWHVSAQTQEMRVNIVGDGQNKDCPYSGWSGLMIVRHM
jgi:hypothetical protein